MSKASKILLWSSNLWLLGWGMFGPLFAVFAGRVGASIFDISWVYAANLALTGLGIIYIGKLSDKYGHEVLLIVGYILTALASFGYLLVHDVWSLFWIQVIMSIGTILSTPTWFALYDRHSGDGSKDGLIWGLFSGMSYFAQAIGLLLGGYIVTVYSWDALFITMGVIISISTVYQAQILIEQNRVQT